MARPSMLEVIVRWRTHPITASFDEPQLTNNQRHHHQTNNHFINNHQRMMLHFVPSLKINLIEYSAPYLSFFSRERKEKISRERCGLSKGAETIGEAGWDQWMLFKQRKSDLEVWFRRLWCVLRGCAARLTTRCTYHLFFISQPAWIIPTVHASSFADPTFRQFGRHKVISLLFPIIRSAVCEVEKQILDGVQWFLCFVVNRRTDGNVTGGEM